MTTIGMARAAMATVLVVDDEPIVREVVVRYLARDGHKTRFTLPAA